MTKDEFKKGLRLFKFFSLKSVPKIQSEEEFQMMYYLWNKVLENPTGEAFYDACLTHAKQSDFFPSVHQVINLLEKETDINNNAPYSGGSGFYGQY